MQQRANRVFFPRTTSDYTVKNRLHGSSFEGCQPRCQAVLFLGPGRLLLRGRLARGRGRRLCRDVHTNLVQHLLSNSTTPIQICFIAYPPQFYHSWNMACQAQGKLCQAPSLTGAGQESPFTYSWTRQELHQCRPFTVRSLHYMQSAGENWKPPRASTKRGPMPGS